MHSISIGRPVLPAVSPARRCAAGTSTRRSGLAALAASLLILAPSWALAAGRVDEFLTIKNWHGTVTITGTGSGSTSGGGYSDVWQFGITSKVNATLDTYDPNLQ